MTHYVIQVIVQVVRSGKQLAHNATECGWCVYQSKWYYFEAIESFVAEESCVEYPLLKSILEKYLSPDNLAKMASALALRWLWIKHGHVI